MTQTRKHFMTCAVAAALASGANAAGASAFQLLEQNASGLGNAYAGQGASAQDASTIFFNPAGMTKLPGRNVVGGVNAIKPSAKFSDAGSLRAPGRPAASPLGGEGGDAGDWAFVPNAYLSWQLTPQLFVGIGVNAPFGLKTEYDPSWVGRFHAIESDLKTINVNPSVAYKVNEMISVGAGINYQRADATLSNAVNFGPAGEGIGTVKGDDSAWGYNVGLMFDLNPATRIGLAYRSAVKYTLTGDVTFSNLPPGVGALAPDGPVRADIKLPSIASLNLFHKIDPKWDVLADVSWTDWSTLKSLDVFRASGALLSTTPLNWKDTWRVAVGANYHHNDMWTLRFGVAYDQSPVPDADRTPRIPDEDRFWLALGAQYRVSKQLAIDFGYAHLFVKDASIDLCRSAAQPGCGTARNRLVGNYNSNKVDIISAQVRYSF